jgi:C4-dicarboxylate-specific signal transduction histidine kinase
MLCAPEHHKRFDMINDARLANDRQVLLRRISDAEEKIARLEDELDQSSRLATLGTLAGMIAHEFNNILTPVLSYAQLALATPDDRELVSKALVRTVDGAEQLARIATAILGFLQGDDQLQEADINRVVDEALACMARNPAKAGVKVIRGVPNGLRARIRPVCLQHVLLNLFLNAVEAMRGRAGELRISASEHGDGRVVIRIADTGCGMPPEVARRVLEPLAHRVQRVAGPQSAGRIGEKGRGHGLGLAVCRRLVEEAGGHISVASELDRGTTFTLDLAGAAVESRRRSA